MSEDKYRRVARSGLAQLVADIPEGPEWDELVVDPAAEPSRRRGASGWLVGAAAAAAVVVVLGAAAVFLGADSTGSQDSVTTQLESDPTTVEVDPAAPLGEGDGWSLSAYQDGDDICVFNSFSTPLGPRCSSPSTWRVPYLFDSVGDSAGITMNAEGGLELEHKLIGLTDESVGKLLVEFSNRSVIELVPFGEQTDLPVRGYFYRFDPLKVGLPTYWTALDASGQVLGTYNELTKWCADWLADAPQDDLLYEIRNEACQADDPSTVVTPNAVFSQIWSLSYPSRWYRADRELMPVLGFQSVTVATIPLRPGGALCAQVPENALRDLGPGDALISVFFAGTATQEVSDWPATLDDVTFPPSGLTDANECAERPELEVHWDGFNYQEQMLWVLVAFGPEVSEETRTETWAVASSLRPVGNLTPGGGACVVTAPPQPGLVPPDPFPATSLLGVWYGTDDLWTELPHQGTVWRGLPAHTDGSLTTKTFWWNQDYSWTLGDPATTDAGPTAEQVTPDITVTARRLDAAAPPVEENRGTNAYTPEAHSSMLVGLALPTAGCWELTATYQNAQLRYVVAIP